MQAGGDMTANQQQYAVVLHCHVYTLQIFNMI